MVKNTKKQKKQRLDNLLHDRFPEFSRRQIQSWIMQGKVLIKGRPETKSGAQVYADEEIVCSFEEPRFVSRAGLKLEKALDYFDIDVNDAVVMDAGLSTGGFSDCLLQRGAKKIYGIDVGYGQVAEKIRTDERMIIHERTNLREVRDLGEKVDLVTLDLSFISILKVMDAVCAVLKEGGKLITLIKPQFEARRDQIQKGGIIKDAAVHQEVVKRVTDGIIAYGFSYGGTIDSPIYGATGNKEFLAYFKKCLS